MSAPPTTEDIKFDWLELHREMDAIIPTETFKTKLFRKVTENPFVPLGCLATSLALGFGLWSFKHGKKKMSQYMMRTRIAAQGFTVLAMILGIGMGAKQVTKKN